jgi:hypothetical protein
MSSIVRGRRAAFRCLVAALLVACSEAANPTEGGNNPPPPPPPPLPPPPPPPPPAGFALTVDNQLLLPVRVTLPSGTIETVQAASNRSFTLATPNGPFNVPWSLVRPTTSGGQAIGDVMSGSFAITPGTAAGITLKVDNVVGTQPYFYPLVSNNTAVPLLMMVNGGLVSENRCTCVVPAFQTRTVIGYYRLYTNSNLRGYRSGNGYTGSYVYFSDFSGSVPRGSGLIELTFTSAP